jgi:hypothetical protein
MDTTLATMLHVWRSNGVIEIRIYFRFWSFPLFLVHSFQRMKTTMERERGAWMVFLCLEEKGDEKQREKHGTHDQP